MKKGQFLIYLALTLVSMFYGINYSVLKIVVPEYADAFGFVFYRILVSAIIFWAIYFFRQEKIDWKNDWTRLILCAITGVGANMLLFFKGIGMTSAVNGAIIMTLTPLLVLIWSLFLLKEKISAIKVIGIFIGLIGAIIIVYDPKSVNAAASWEGDLLIILNGISYAAYLVLIKPLMLKYKPITVITWIFTIGLLLVTPLSIKSAFEIDIVSMPNHVILAGLYSIIFVTAIVYFLNIWTLAKVKPSTVGSFIYLQPVFATITAILFFQESLLNKHIIASIFIFSGVFLVTKNN